MKHRHPTFHALTPAIEEAKRLALCSSETYGVQWSELRQDFTVKPIRSVTAQTIARVFRVGSYPGPYSTHVIAASSLLEAPQGG